MIAIVVVLIMALALIYSLYEHFEPVQATLIVVAIAVAATGGFLYFKHTLDNKRENDKYIAVQYRPDKIDVTTDNFIRLDPVSLRDYNVGGAWYDEGERYMIIKLRDKYYHYCAMPKNIWNGLNNTRHLYNYYKDKIKGNYDCRVHTVPTY